MNFAAVALISFFGSTVQSATGFGYAIICMAVWPLVIPFRTASVIESVTAFAMVAYITLRLRRHINWKLLLPSVVPSVLMSTFGVVSLMTSTETLLRRILGGILCVLAVYFIFFSERIRLRPSLWAGAAAGLLSGYFGGLLNIGGPPMVAYFLSATEDKLEYNATLQCYFCLTTVYIFLMHFLIGNVNGEAVRYGGAALLGLAVGTAAGFAVFQRLSMPILKKCVYAFMTVMGIYLMIHG